ncbi:long-chain-fatty-acid--CoA ligase 2 [[Candida] jaroonii]|uniref:Long-chain-fatty-acid--CoA ligase 2 n=1 Tax=[Candida] jaroonii TaxID=467808 RepID=A0ACA9Y799_9ASCO|nr:long-chain-fatty-acid--CoA ligase 2 [[Candida] jaroonii]
MSLYPNDPQHIEAIVSAVVTEDESLISYGIPLPNTDQPGYSNIYRNKYSPDKLLETIHPSLDTFAATFKHSVAAHGDKLCFGSLDPSTNTYQYETYKQIDNRRKNFAAGMFYVLKNNKFQPSPEVQQKIQNHGKTDEESFIVSLFSHNRKEWCITDVACSTYSILNTALYDTLGPKTSEYILSTTKSPIIVCSGDKLRSLIDLKLTYPTELVNLTTLVSMDDFDSSLIGEGEKAGLAVHAFHQVEIFGKINPVDEVPPTPQTPYSISFTSGTTGANPKGVILSHKNGVASLVFCLTKNNSRYNQDKIGDNPTNYYSFLPLAHIYERMNINFALLRGFKIGFPSTTNPANFLTDVQVIKPHGLLLVPRVLTKIESTLKSQTIHNSEKPVLQYLFKKLVDYKVKEQSKHDGARGESFFYDKLSGLIRKKLGFDNVISIGCGSAPISPDTIKFLKAILSVGISQGYGLTESFAGICSTPSFDSNPGSCGPPSVTCEVRVREIPEMNYHINDEGGPRGELQLRGPQIFSGYYKNAEETAKALDKDGWFSTGDVAKIDELGRIHIIDRVKNFFKLAQGEYISPEKIENIYLSCFPLLSQIFVHGDSLQTYLVAIVGIEPESIKGWIKKNFGDSVNDKDILDYMNNPKVKTVFVKAMNKSVDPLLHGFEKVHNVLFDFEPLKLSDDVITPTMKVKRPIAKRFFSKQLEALYEEGSLIRSEKL